MTSLTVGYGDITPVNDEERLFVIFNVLVTCIIFGYSVNKIGTIFNSMSENQNNLDS